MVTKQRINGISHPDTFGLLRCHYRLIDGHYVPFEADVQTEKGDILARQSLDRAKAGDKLSQFDGAVETWLNQSMRRQDQPASSRNIS